MNAFRRPRRGREAAANSALAPVFSNPVRALILAVGAVALLSVILAVMFSSPDEPPITIRQWSRQSPIDFLKTAVDELGQTSGTAEYGPPYNHDGSGQHAAFLRPQKWLGVSHPIDTAEDYVIGPLRSVPNALLQRQITEYLHASRNLKIDGLESMERVLSQLTAGSGGSVTIPPGEYENVDSMMKALLDLAQSGGLDGDLLTGQGLLQTDYTKPLLFIADGGLLERRAALQQLPAHQWAMMDETGAYPGLPELWPYTFWYEIEPFKSSKNRDILVWLAMAVLALALICVPLLPGVRSIPRLIPLHRLIWREYYRQRSIPRASP